MPRQATLLSAKLPALAAQAICGNVQSTTAAGSTAADATKITSGMVLFTTASAGGAALPPSQPGDSFEIKNESGATVTLYPSSTAGTVTINTTTSLSVPTAKSCRVWFSSPTACHSTPTVVS
jgi:hypothetical protein